MTPFAALLMSVAILLMGNGLQFTLLPVRANIEAFNRFEIGTLGSAYFLGFTFGCLAGQWIIARVGHTKAFLAFVSLASTMALIHAVLINPVVWWMVRGVTGFCFAALFVIIESWLNAQSDNTTRGAVFSVYTVINLTVITIGQLLIVFGDPATFSLFALASILVSLSGVPIAMSRAPIPEAVSVVLPRLGQLYRSAPVGFVGCVVFGISMSSFWAFGPIYAMEAGLSTTGIGVFMCLSLLGGAVGQWPLGALSDLIDRRLVILGSCLAAVLAGIVLGQVYPSGLLRLSAFGFLYGMFAFPLYALAVAHANDYAESENFVETSSGLLLAFGAGAVAGPAFATLAVEHGGPAWMFYFSAAVLAATALFALWRIMRRDAIAPDDKVDFADALTATQSHTPYEISDHTGKDS